MEEIPLNFPADIKRQIALKLHPSDVIKLCKLSSEYNNDICNNNDFWRLKLQLDFPTRFNLLTSQGIVFKNPKATYIREFLAISTEIDKFLDNINIKTSDKNRKPVFDKIYSKIDESYDTYNEKFSTTFAEWIYENIFNNKTKLIRQYHGIVNNFSLIISRKIRERL